jgi:hypothetical protein
MPRHNPQRLITVFCVIPSFFGRRTSPDRVREPCVEILVRRLYDDPCPYVEAA